MQIAHVGGILGQEAVHPLMDLIVVVPLVDSAHGMMDNDFVHPLMDLIVIQPQEVHVHGMMEIEHVQHLITTKVPVLQVDVRGLETL
jgi:hypothetical protein